MIFLRSQQFNETVFAYWGLAEAKCLDGHGYGDYWLTSCGQDVTNGLSKRVYYHKRFDDSHTSNVETRPLTNIVAFAGSHDGVDCMQTGGQTDANENETLVEQFRANTPSLITRSAGTALTTSRQFPVGTCSRNNDHWTIGGNQSVAQFGITSPTNSIEVLNYDVNATMVAQGTIVSNGTAFPLGCGNGSAAFVRTNQNFTTDYAVMEVVNIADSSGGTTTSYIAQEKITNYTQTWDVIGAACSIGKDAVFLDNFQIGSVTFDDALTETIWSLDPSSRHNRAKMATNGVDIVINGGCIGIGSNNATTQTKYIKADPTSTSYITGQSVGITLKNHFSTGYQ